MHVWLLLGPVPAGRASLRDPVALHVRGGAKRGVCGIGDLPASNAYAHATREEHGVGGADHGGHGVRK